VNQYQRNRARQREMYGDTIPDFVQHGSSITYSNWRCRCQPCRAAWADLIREMQKARKAKGVPDDLHGRASTYGNWCCRCEPCTAAWTADSRRRKGSLPLGFRTKRDVVMPAVPFTPDYVLMDWWQQNGTETAADIRAAVGRRLQSRTPTLRARRQGVRGWSLSHLDKVHPDLLTRGESVERPT